MPAGPSELKVPKTTKFKPQRPTKGAEPRAAQSRSTDNASDEPSTQVSVTDPSHSIPSDLLTKLVHEFLEDDKMRVGKDANALIGKYMDTFVKEAIHRAREERGTVDGNRDNFLEVEDLEKLAPQLLLDF
ncbi:MAG: hypothetical protein M1825_004573 [Sarcosagium campestre]|nr:MAG: hypothetical protein M1825_004573 [Sarcosagium campestre]